jgi:hypothetical protein
MSEPKVINMKKFKYWVRNLFHDTWEFRLPLSNGHFFHPDFVAMLNDGQQFPL